MKSVFRAALPLVLFAFLALPLTGCVTIAGVGAGLAAAAKVIDVATTAAPAVKAAVAAVKSRDGISEKAAEFRRRYCSEAEIRAESREALVDALVAGGVPPDKAHVHVAQLKDLGARICGGG